MTLQTDLETAVAQVQADAATLEAIVNGPATGEGSLVATDGGDVKSVARAIAEIGDTTNQALKDLSNVLDADFAAKAAAAGVDGTVTSVATAGLATGGPITGSGTIMVNVASQAEAEAGTAADKAMTPQRVAQAIAALASGEDQIARDMAVAALIEANAAGVEGTKGRLVLVNPFTSDTLDVVISGSDMPYFNKRSHTSASAYLRYSYSTYEALNAFDDDTGTHWFSNQSINTNSNGIDYLGVQLDAAYAITKARIYNIDQAPATVKVQYSDDGSAWSDAVASWSLSGSIGAFIETTWSNVGSHAYWRLLSSSAATADSLGNPSGGWRCAELEFFEGTAYNDTDDYYTTLGSLVTPVNATFAVAGGGGGLDTADPSDLSAYFLFVFPDADVTVGTDVTGELSIDGGTTQATGAWTKIGDYGAGELWRLDADVSAQTGDNPHWEINTLNNKSVELHACGGILPIYAA